MRKVKCYNCKKEEHFAKECKKAKDQAWMKSTSDSDQELSANMVFMAKMEKILSDSEEILSSAEETIAEIKEQEDLIDTMSDQLVELKNTLKIKQTTISELKECLLKKDSENEHMKSKIVDFTTVQNLQVQVEELNSVNESLNLTVEEISKAHELTEATLRERDEMISAQCKKIRLLEEQSEIFHEVPSEFDSEIVHDTQENSENDLILFSELLEKLMSSDQEMKQQIIIFEEDKRMFLAKNKFLEKVSSSVKNEYNDLLASNDVLKQRLETKFKFSKHDTSLGKMIEMIEKEYESNVSKISITSSTFETKNSKLVKEMRDKVKCFDEEKKAFETTISKFEGVLAKGVKDFDEVQTELSKRTDKFETYFANLEKENALLKSQLASQNYTSLHKENNDLRTSYNVLKEKYETSCEKIEKENNDLKMHYKRLFDSIKHKKIDSQVFTKSIPKVNILEKIYTGKSSKPISRKVYQFTTYSLQKDKK
ncbi:outer membrane protein porin [Tanacetum coccineum]